MTNAHGLGRLPSPDARDAAYPIRGILPAQPSLRRYRYWNDSGWWGDQGMTSQCVAYSWVHYLEDGPITQSGPVPCVVPGHLYHDAQLIDEWPGEGYDGTSVRAGAKALQSRGLLRTYLWAQTIDDIVQALLEVGPVVVGTNWYSGMFDPDPAGFLTVEGGIVGGHAYVLNGINRLSGIIRVKNSWGRSWGVQGRALLRIADVERLLAEEGEACLATELRRP